MYFRFTGDIQSMRPCPRPPPPLPMALGPVTITSYKERLARRAFVKGHTVLSNDLNGVECPMATHNRISFSLHLISGSRNQKWLTKSEDVGSMWLHFACFSSKIGFYVDKYTYRDF